MFCWSVFPKSVWLLRQPKVNVTRSEVTEEIQRSRKDISRKSGFQRGDFQDTRPGSKRRRCHGPGETLRLLPSHLEIRGRRVSGSPPRWLMLPIWKWKWAWSRRFHLNYTTTDVAVFITASKVIQIFFHNASERLWRTSEESHGGSTGSGNCWSFREVTEDSPHIQLDSVDSNKPVCLRDITVDDSLRNGWLRTNASAVCPGLALLLSKPEDSLSIIWLKGFSAFSSRWLVLHNRSNAIQVYLYQFVHSCENKERISLFWLPVAGQSCWVFGSELVWNNSANKHRTNSWQWIAICPWGCLNTKVVWTHQADAISAGFYSVNSNFSLKLLKETSDKECLLNTIQVSLPESKVKATPLPPGGGM